MEEQKVKQNVKKVLRPRSKAVKAVNKTAEKTLKQTKKQKPSAQNAQKIVPKKTDNRNLPKKPVQDVQVKSKKIIEPPKKSKGWNSKNKIKPVRIIFLGGVGEIGKNMTAIECGDDIIIIDAGAIFPTDETPGFDLIVPDVTYLVENKHKVRGVILTHGHEDHIGGVPYLLKELKVPVGRAYRFKDHFRYRIGGRAFIYGRKHKYRACGLYNERSGGRRDP